MLAAFEMDEILLRAARALGGPQLRPLGLHLQLHQEIPRRNRDFCLADRAQVTMTAPFLRAYALLLIKTCHRRGAHAMGGMAAQIPIKNDRGRERRRRSRKCAPTRCAKRPTATTARGSRTRAWSPSRRRSSTSTCRRRTRSTSSATTSTSRRSDLLDFQPEKPITEAGLRNNINVGIQYLGAWLAGNGCVPIYNLMEDAATAEISRSQIWQWIRSPKGVLDDGRKVTASAGPRSWCPKSSRKCARCSASTPGAPGDTTRRRASSTRSRRSDEYVEFLTLPAYELLTRDLRQPAHA